MNILHICTSYCWTEVYAILIRALNKKGLHQTVYVPLRNRADIGKKRVEDPMVHYEYSYMLKPVMRLLYFHKIKSMYKDVVARINMKEISLVHAHFLFTDGGTAYYLKKHHGIKYVTAVRNTDVNAYFRYFIHARRFAVKIMQEAEAVVFISPAYRTYVLENYVPAHARKAISEKAVVIPNSIDNFWLANQPAEGRTIKDDVIKFIFVGELSKNKNVHKTINIVKKLNERRKATLIIIGKKSDYAEEILKLVAENKEIVQYIEPIYDKEKLLAYYRKVDIFIMPSQFETFGLAYVEAMSQGIPSLFSKGQGIDGFFIDGEVGYGIDADNVEDALEKIDAIIRNYEQMSVNCIANAKGFAPDIIVDRVLRMYGN